jgi:hypothetical protein
MRRVVRYLLLLVCQVAVLASAPRACASVLPPTDADPAAYPAEEPPAGAAAEPLAALDPGDRSPQAPAAPGAIAGGMGSAAATGPERPQSPLSGCLPGQDAVYLPRAVRLPPGQDLLVLAGAVCRIFRPPRLPAIRALRPLS